MLEHQHYNEKGLPHDFGPEKVSMNEDMVESAMEPTHAAIILGKNPNAYAETAPYKGGMLTAERTGLQAKNVYIVAIKEDNFVIGYTLRNAEEIFDFLKDRNKTEKVA